MSSIMVNVVIVTWDCVSGSQIFGKHQLLTVKGVNWMDWQLKTCFTVKQQLQFRNLCRLVLLFSVPVCQKWEQEHNL